MVQIYLTEFRKDNKLTQQELADVLGTSRSFLSLVESGKSKLPDDKIDKIYFESRMKGWDFHSLNPLYFRLMVLNDYLFEPGNTTGTNWDFESGHSLLPISKTEMLRIKHAKCDDIDAVIKEILSKYPEISDKWIRYGIGDITDNPEKLFSSMGHKSEYVKEPERSNNELFYLLYSISKRLERIEEKLGITLDEPDYPENEEETKVLMAEEMLKEMVETMKK